MPRLPVRWLPVRLERLLGLWRLRRLLLVLGLLSLVLDQITLTNAGHRAGSCETRPAVLFAPPRMLAIHLWVAGAQWRGGGHRRSLMQG